ncbi:hypothetical protein CsSME_00021190 [Camellia sinensis var. sinensis]
MTGIELPGQLAGVEGAAPLGGSGAVPRRGRGAAPPKQNAKMHTKLPVRSSGECWVSEVCQVCKNTGRCDFALERVL